MKKIIIFLLVAILACSIFGCNAKASVTAPEQVPVSGIQKTEALNQEGNGRTEAPITEATETETSKIVEAEAPVHDAEEKKQIVLAEEKNTYWSDEKNEYNIRIYDDGTAYLFTLNIVLTLEEDGDEYLAKSELYRSPFDTEPAVSIAAGTIRLISDGYTLKLEVTDDPLGILKYDAMDGKVLEKRDFEPYRYPDHNFFSGPLEPGTEWFCYFNMGEYHFARLNMTIAGDGSINGTLTMPDGTQRVCALLVNKGSFALVDESAESYELLFYGERNLTYETYYNTERYGLVRIALNPVADPLGLCLLSEFNLRRQDGREGDFPYILGKSLDSLILELTREGWKDKTDEIAELAPALEGWYAQLTADDKTLLIYYMEDWGIPYEAYQRYVYAYVLYGADGSVLDWSGSKPVDHAIADSYHPQKGVHFDPGTGIEGLLVGEDTDTYFLDDGRIVIRSVAHTEDPDAEDEGDIYFKIVKVIP